ncbi:MAG: hypothetical protein CBCREVIR_2420 [Candidatus Burkholderia crenata]|nr:MAG: hypothetical protein CBCREVIR_2420 [Candidatus Burkholderia crenata]
MPDLPLSLWLSITALGSVGVMIPLALAVAAWLALGYPWRYAACWLAVLGAASGLVLLTKIAFMGWGVGVRDLDFTGISGHAMVSAAVLPVALFVACLPGRRWVRAFGVSAGVLIGIVVGALAALVFVAFAWRAEPGKLAAAPVAVSLAMVAITLHGISVPTQRWITDIALHLSGREQPYIRARWKAGRYDKPVAPPAQHY